MSEDDIIRVRIDDTDLDRALIKVNQIILKGTQLTGTSNITSGSKKLWSDWRAFNGLMDQTESKVPKILQAFGAANLPTVNRELRLILGQIPGMRDIMDDYFQLKRLQRGVGIATAEGTLLSPTLIMTLIAVAVQLLTTIRAWNERIRIEKRQQERLIRSYKELSHKEYTEIIKTEKNNRRRFPG